MLPLCGYQRGVQAFLYLVSSYLWAQTQWEARGANVEKEHIHSMVTVFSHLHGEVEVLSSLCFTDL